MRTRVYLDFITQKSDNNYQLEGYLSSSSKSLVDELYFKTGNKLHKADYITNQLINTTARNHGAVAGSRFNVNITIPNDTKVKLYAIFAGQKVSIKTHRFTRLPELVFAYRRDGNKLLRLFAGQIVVSRFSRTKSILFELLTIFSIFIDWRIGHAMRRTIVAETSKQKIIKLLQAPVIILEAVITIPTAIATRLMYRYAKIHQTKPVWLFSDRGMSAGDNGEALFRYIVKQNDKTAEMYFTLSKKSKDFARISSLGEVLDYGSIRYRLMFLLASKVISSQADIETTNPFGRQVNRFVDLMGFDYIFLQHGVITQDLTAWLNRYEKDIKLFITSGKKEYDSIHDSSYGYTERQLLLSGMPRYDYLESRPQGKLILAPTYRTRLIRLKTNSRGERRYDRHFKNSDYYSFYNKLINDSRLINSMKRRGLTGELYVHPVFAAQAVDFRGNNHFKVMDFPYDYQNAFAEGNMLITDRSSLVFDFAYLKKPIIYSRFDDDTFFDGHSYDRASFFDDKNDGFGEIFYDYESLVVGLVKTIDDGLEMSEEYQKRVDRFFYKIDKNNSKRVYQAICDLENKV